jgi:hypothetical protein
MRAKARRWDRALQLGQVTAPNGAGNEKEAPQGGGLSSAYRGRLKVTVKYVSWFFLVGLVSTGDADRMAKRRQPTSIAAAGVDGVELPRFRGHFMLFRARRPGCRRVTRSTPQSFGPGWWS